VYNLIVGAVDGVLPAERLLEVVEEGAEDFVGTAGARNIGRLMTLPTLLMPEIGDDRHVQTAEVGSVADLSRVGRNYQFHFVRNTTIPSVPSEHVKAMARELHIGDWDLTRTRWSVKNSDLYRALLEDYLTSEPSPKVFKLPPNRPEPGRIAVMMPFDAAFDSVWHTLKDLAAESGWPCQRADDIWEDDVIINDVVSLIARSTVVICDLTNRNSNVFYEAGIAHTLGREVILIAQTQHDVPFDLRHYRHARYLANTEGLKQLKATLLPRLHDLMNKY